MCDSRNYNGVYSDLARILGPDATETIYKHFKGKEVTFPVRLKSKYYIANYLMKHYDGSNISELANELGYTERWLRILIGKIEKGEY